MEGTEKSCKGIVTREYETQAFECELDNVGVSLAILRGSHDRSLPLSEATNTRSAVIVLEGIPALQIVAQVAQSLTTTSRLRRLRLTADDFDSVQHFCLTSLTTSRVGV